MSDIKFTEAGLAAVSARAWHTGQATEFMRVLMELDEEGTPPYWHVCEAVKAALAAPPVPASGGQEPWAYGIETPGGDMYDGEYAVFGDEHSARDQVENLNDEIPEGEDQYKVVPLFAAAPSPAPASQPALLVGPDGDHHTQDWFDGYEEARMHFEVTIPASQPDAWTAARHWLLTDDTPNDIALEEGSRRIASLARLLTSRASQPEQTVVLTVESATTIAVELIEHFKKLAGDGYTHYHKNSMGRMLLAGVNAALASPGGQPPNDSESAAGKTAEATTQGTVTPPDSPQPLEANLEYLRNLAATDISNEIPLTDAQFNWLQERLRKLVRAVVGTGESRQ